MLSGQTHSRPAGQRHLQVLGPAIDYFRHEYVSCVFQAPVWMDFKVCPRPIAGVQISRCNLGLPVLPDILEADRLLVRVCYMTSALCPA